MRNTGLEEAQAGIKIAGRNINNLRYADDTTLMAESEEELGSIPGLGRSPGGGNGNLFQDSHPKNPMGTGVWWATDHRVANSRT